MTELIHDRGYSAYTIPVRGKQLEPGESEYSRYLWVLERVPRGAKVLDVGCNGGQMLRQLWSHRGIIGVGVDIDPAQIEFARSRVQWPSREPFPLRWHAGPAELVCHDLAEELPFDVVIAGEVIEHVDRVGDFLAACYGALAPEGRLLLTCPTPEGPGGNLWTRPEHRRVFTRAALEEELRAAGFEVVEYATLDKDDYGPTFQCVRCWKAADGRAA